LVNNGGEDLASRHTKQNSGDGSASEQHQHTTQW
jgi:hypothetical protein